MWYLPYYTVDLNRYASLWTVYTGTYCNVHRNKQGSNKTHLTTLDSINNELKLNYSVIASWVMIIVLKCEI